MNTTLVIVSIIVVAGLVWQFFEYRKAVGRSREYTKRRVTGLIFMGFSLLVGFPTIILDVVFDWLGIEKPNHFEWIALIAYAIFTLAAVFILKDGNSGVVKIDHSGSGDIVEGDKIGGDKVHGNKYQIEGKTTIYQGKRSKPRLSMKFDWLGTNNQSTVGFNLDPRGRKAEWSWRVTLSNDSMEYAYDVRISIVGKSRFTYFPLEGYVGAIEPSSKREETVKHVCFDETWKGQAPTKTSRFPPDLWGTIIKITYKSDEEEEFLYEYIIDENGKESFKLTHH